MDTREVAVEITGLTKVYKLYERNRDRLLEVFGLRNVKRHREHYALRDFAMTVYKGETVGIIGTNGSGKSTLLKMITGVLSPTQGNIVVNGRISALLELGAGFNMEYTGLENIYLNGTMIGFTKKEIDSKLEDILSFADIGDYIYQPVKTYSSGMFVRLAFAVAINIEPEILIVDEALSVGDVFFQSKCYHKFEEFKKMGKTILFVSHDLSSIHKYCDRVVLLNKGYKVGEGTSKEMIDAYKRVLVGQFDSPDVQQEHVPDALNEYGTKQAVMKEYYLTDLSGVRTAILLKGTTFSIHETIEVLEDLPAPIFTFTFKDVKGTEITGTNTMYERAFLEPVKAGSLVHVTFTQEMNLQGGDYLLSMSVTGYEGEQFVVYHRLYDALKVTVVSDKDTVGYYDMNSEVEVTCTPMG